MNALTVSILTPGGSTKQQWQAEVVSDSEELLVLHGKWERLLHMKVGEVPVKNQTLECYWSEQPYTVSAVYDQHWQLREYYARLLRDFKRAGESIEYVDIGRHLSVKPDDGVRVIEESASMNGTGKDLELEAGWEALLASAKERSGPFAPGFFEAYRPE